MAVKAHAPYAVPRPMAPRRTDGEIRARVSREERDMLNLLRRFWKAQAVYCESDHEDTDSATLRRALRMFVRAYQDQNEDFRRFYVSADFRAEYESEAKRG